MVVDFSHPMTANEPSASFSHHSMGVDYLKSAYGSSGCGGISISPFQPPIE
jgi:hypothetical protein